ncbi:hypothetical protein ES319_D06G251700v1 [Gossypium barbadense]|uniref:Uncharacterized protein n=2 Tax=Gossypium TaxID=3633 RepID=A0A5J5R995_GOSBA|nr:hypothetical protein ES319_D06G251700v1 [Gossypium barbadense]PPD78142.1 hypothetical protein GOBAR_DD24943 [Gossypium barbadense]TYG66395.1 hypothetical protein ES288_D06G264800v1 [Gossypium darwinii]
MAQVLNLNSLGSSSLFTTRPESSGLLSINASRTQHVGRNWSSLVLRLKCNGRFCCLFSDNRREEQARKALESALGGKKTEFEKWNKEIKRREEAGGGDNAGGGGWSGWGGRFGWSNGDHFWQEAQQASLAILGIIVMYLVIAKGELLLAVIFNPLLYALRGTRDGFSYVTLKILGNGPVDSSNTVNNEAYVQVSAKESVLRKWGSN